MPMTDPVGDTRSPSESGCGDADRSKFICCVEGSNPEINEVWIFGKDSVTP